ncbi:MAG: ComEC/Rec2 family competence protein, partial [Clostridia bacterium]|nr:ComEC/Rec2 family competence protein [Clostridia bacterium]
VTSLFFSVALIVLLSPAAITDIGLLLSFLATLGILMALEAFPRRPRSWLGRVLVTLLLSLLSTVFAVAFTLPVTAVVFGGISLVSPLSNLIVSPLLHLMLIIGPFLLLFPTALSAPAQMVGDLIVNIVEDLSGIRGIYLFTSYPLFILALFLFSVYLLFLLLRRGMSRRGFLVRLLPSVAILISVLLGCSLFEASEDLLLYTRQGTEEYITLRTDGRATVIGRAGKQTSIFRLEEELTAHRISEIDLLVLSCYEAGAASYLEALNERITVHSLLLVPPKEETENYHAVLYTAKRLGIPCDVKETLQNNGASRGFVSVESADEEHSGLFFRVSYRDTELRYISQGYLQTVDREALGIFLREADLLILGAHAATGEREEAIDTPPNLTVLVADPKSAPTSWQKEKEGVVLSPDTFLYRFP